MGTLFPRNPFFFQNCGAFSTHQGHSCCLCWCSWPVSFNPISNVRLCLSSHSLSLMLELQPELQVQSQTYKMSVTQITSSQVMGSGYSCSEWMSWKCILTSICAKNMTIIYAWSTVKADEGAVRKTCLTLGPWGPCLEVCWAQMPARSLLGCMI